MKPLPAMFYLPPSLDLMALRVGDSFDTVYAPNLYTGEGWRVITFRVGLFHHLPKKPPVRMYAVECKRAVSVTEAEALFARAQDGAPLEVEVCS